MLTAAPLIPKKILFAWSCCVCGLLNGFAETSPDFFATFLAVAGDSTAARHVAHDYETEPWNTQQGWGEGLRNAIDLAKVKMSYPKISTTVYNRAQSGSSAKSFYENLAKKGDGTPITLWNWILEKRPRYILLQFGINDRTDNDPVGTSIDDEGTFCWYLGKMIHEATAIGATPILITQTPSRSTAEQQSISLYREAMLSVAHETNTVCVDMYKIFYDYCRVRGKAWGDSQVNVYHANYKNTDRLHLSITGAHLFPRFITRSIPTDDFQLRLHPFWTKSHALPEYDLYWNWIGEYPIIMSPEEQRPLADPDSDGLSNFEEYCFQGAPNRSDTSIPLRAFIDKDTSTCNFVGQVNPEATWANISIQYGTCSNLEDWSTAILSEEEIATGEASRSFDLNTYCAGFARFSINVPDEFME